MVSSRLEFIAAWRKHIENEQNDIQKIQAQIKKGQADSSDRFEKRVAELKRQKKRLNARFPDPDACPQCWYRDYEIKLLRAIPSGDGPDLLKCHRCGAGADSILVAFAP